MWKTLIPPIVGLDQVVAQVFGIQTKRSRHFNDHPFPHNFIKRDSICDRHLNPVPRHDCIIWNIYTWHESTLFGASFFGSLGWRAIELQSTSFCVTSKMRAYKPCTSWLSRLSPIRTCSDVINNSQVTHVR